MNIIDVSKNAVASIPRKKIRIVAPPDYFSDEVKEGLMDAEVCILDDDEVCIHAPQYVFSTGDVVVSKGLLIRALRGQLTADQLHIFEAKHNQYLCFAEDSYEVI